MDKEQLQKELSGRNQASAWNDLLERRLVLKAVDDEPEYPGDMPDALWTALLARDRGLVSEAFRLTVKLTKQGIRDRIKAL